MAKELNSEGENFSQVFVQKMVDVGMQNFGLTQQEARDAASEYVIPLPVEENPRNRFLIPKAVDLVGEFSAQFRTRMVDLGVEKFGFKASVAEQAVNTFYGNFDSNDQKSQN